MNWKLVTAFAAGAIIASGIVYVSVKGIPEEKPVAAQPVVAQVEAPQPVPIPAARAAKPSAPAGPEPVPAAPPEASKQAVKAPKAAVAKQVSPQHASPARPVPAVPAKPSPFAPRAPEPAREMTAQIETPAPAPEAPAAPAPAPEAVQQQTPAPVPPQPPAQPTSVAAPPEQPPSQAEGRVPHTVTLTAGTLLAVRIGETISSARNQIGDSFLATLEKPLVIDGFIIAERGARVEGRVVESAQASRNGSASRLGIALVRLSTSDNQSIRIRTEPFKKEAGNSAGSDAAKIGAGAAIGAVIGAMAGGGKGAAIGAGAGTAAGAGAVLLTRGRQADIPVETRLSFRVEEPVTITEKLD